MEVRDGLPELIRRIAGEEALEPAEGAAALVEVVRILYLVVACGILNKEINSPISALGIHIEGFPVFCAHQGQSFPVGVAAVFNDGLAQIAGHSLDILHQGLGILKHLGVHALKDVAAVTGQKKGVVDVAVSVALAAFYFPLGGEACCGLH